MAEWKPQVQEGTQPSLEEWIFQALGAASTCWESLDGTGVFDSDRAKEIGDSLIEHIRELDPVMDDENDEDPRAEDRYEARLGCATTEEMFRELICRFTIRPPGAIDNYAFTNRALALAEMLGELSAPDKEYRTVDGGL